MQNRALIFIKPHAVRPKAIEFIERFLVERKVELIDSGELDSAEIRERGIIDRHYFAIARSAADLPAAEQEFSDDAAAQFRKAFGSDLREALDSGRLLNSEEAQARLGGIDGAELNRRWVAGSQTKLGPGLYAGRLEGDDLYVLNGFYPAMKERFTAPGLTIRWYDAGFDPQDLAWKQFRGEVIGATDPAKAADGSLRAELLRRYAEFGLDDAPSMTNNGVHASAGPIEGLRERMVWLGADPYGTALGKALQKAGVSREGIESLLANGEARFGDETGPVFDITEETDARDIPGALKPLV